jgi:hypothetical protein
MVLESCWYVFSTFHQNQITDVFPSAQNFPKARERLEDLKKGGSKASLKSRERISRSKVGKQNEGECTVM